MNELQSVTATLLEDINHDIHFDGWANSMGKLCGALEELGTPGAKPEVIADVIAAAKAQTEFLNAGPIGREDGVPKAWKSLSMALMWARLGDDAKAPLKIRGAMMKFKAKVKNQAVSYLQSNYDEDRAKGQTLEAHIETLKLPPKK